MEGGEVCAASSRCRSGSVKVEGGSADKRPISLSSESHTSAAVSVLAACSVRQLRVQSERLSERPNDISKRESGAKSRRVRGQSRVGRGRGCWPGREPGAAVCGTRAATLGIRSGHALPWRGPERCGAARSWPSLRPVSAISLVKRPKRGRSLRAHPAHRPASAGGVGRPSPQATLGRTLAPAAREADWARCRPSVKKQQTARPAAAPHVSTAHVSSPDTP